MTVRSIRPRVLADSPSPREARQARDTRVCERGTVEAIGDGDRLTVRVASAPVEAALAQIPGYRPSIGDEVLVTWVSDADACVTCALRAAVPPALVLADGSRAELVDGALELRDGEGELLVRYADGAATVAAPKGDLTLAAPRGAVVIKAASDVSIDAPRDLAQRAGRRVDIAAGTDAPQLRVEVATTHVNATRLHVDARTTRIATGDATVIARAIATTAESIATNVERYGLTASRLVERARDAFRDVADLFQLRSGRMKTIVEDDYAVHARRTVLESKDDTTIDGKKILIG